MAKKSWWKRTKKKEAKYQVDIVKDVNAIVEFLNDIHYDVKSLLPELQKLKDLETERKVANDGIIQINLETQAGVLDTLLEKYEFLQNDADINNLRLKAIAKQFLRNARSAGLKDLAKEKQQDNRWKFFW
jgi:hypothetical protein